MKNFIVFCLVFLVNFQKGRASALISTSMELCGHETKIELSELDETSSMIVTLLSPIDNNNDCKLRVTAPKTHLINMHFIETNAELTGRAFNNYSQQHLMEQQQHPSSCMMRIYLPENPQLPVWQDDLCSLDSIKDIDLLTSNFEIVWTPPIHPKFASKSRKFVLTAVGQGQICKEPGQHTCMKIGWDPMLCISDQLVCDGINNCPKTSTTSDEDEKLCKSPLFAQSSWNQLAEEIWKHFKTPSEMVSNNNKWLLSEKFEENSTTSSTPKRAFLNWKEWQELKKIESNKIPTTMKPVKEEKNKVTDSISQVLSKYGPWGYLMLGMLICGTVLMFCGLWECCFRKPKSQMDLTTPTPQPTTVLIINNQQQQQDDILNNSSASPPNYEDLDQPPSYTTLFPNLKDQSSSSIIVEIGDNHTNNNCSCSDNVDADDVIRQNNIDET